MVATCEEYVLGELQKLKEENSRLLETIVKMSADIQRKNNTIEMLESHLTIKNKEKK